MTRYLILFVFLLFSSCNEITKEFYHVKSPDTTQVLTLLNIVYLFESGQLESGIYLFVGKYDKTSTLPKEYLKLKYSDLPLGIVWEDTIVFSYDFIEKNMLTTNKDLKVFDDVGSLQYKKIDSLYRLKTGHKRTAYFLDEIFDNPIK